MRARAAALAVVLFTGAACGGSDDAGAGAEAPNDGDALTDLAALQGTMSDALVERAQAEGQLLVYTSNSDLEDLADVFEDQFDIDVVVYRAGSEAVIQRVLQEADAGRVEADVIESLGPEMQLLAREGVFTPYDHGLAEQLRPGSVFEGWTAERFNAFVVAWNPDVIGDETPPRAWADLADDRWDGRLSLEVGDFDWYATLRQHLISEGATEEEADEIFRRIADGARVVDGHTAQAELLAAGEIGVVASAFTHSIDDAAEAGAPVRWAPTVEPVIVKPAGVGIVRGVRHPAAAALFYEWLLTDAQQLLADDHRIPASSAVADPLAGIATIPIDDTLLATSGEEWSNRYEDLIQ